MGEALDEVRRIGVTVWVALSVAAFIAFVLWNDPLRNILWRMQPLAIAAVLLASVTGIGWIATRRDLLFSVAIGLGIVALIVFVAGVLRYLEPALLAAIVIVGVTLFVIAMIRGPLIRPSGTFSPQAGRRAILGWIGLGSAIVLIMPFVLSPELSTDALQYHLLVPRLYLDQKAITYLPLFVGSNYPGLAEYVYAVGLTIGDDIAAKTFHFLIGIAVLFAIRRLTRQLAPESDGVLAAALFFVAPVTLITTSWALNDMMFTLFILLSVSELLERRFVSAGLLFGLATWTKYTFVLFVIPFAAILVFGIVRKLWNARDLVRFAVPVAGVASIWLIKNAMLTGNPVYPFLNGVFHSPYWDEASSRYFHHLIQRSDLFVWDWRSYFTFPFLLTLRQTVIDAQPGPLWLVLLPLLFFKTEDVRETLLRVFVAATIVSWLFMHSVTRSLLAMFAVMAVLFAISIARRPLRFLGPLIAAGFVANLWLTSVMSSYLTKPIAYFIGLESRNEFLAREEPRQRLYLWMNEQPSVSGALLVGMHDPYNLRKRMLFSSYADKPAVQDLVERTGSAGQMAAALRGLGISHIAVDRSGYARENAGKLFSWNDRQREVFREFLRTRTRSVTAFDDIVVFQLTP